MCNESTPSDLSGLSNVSSKEKKTVSNTLSYPNDIAPHQCIQLWAGVGAGKNFFIESIINGDLSKNIPKLTVLLISSRKSKIVETLNAKGLDVCNHMTNKSNRESLPPDEVAEYTRLMRLDGTLYEIVQRSVICTNAYIEKYHQLYYDPQDPETHLWNRFDLIVWDEAHALTIDSTFQTAPPHVLNLLHETYRRMKKRDTEAKDVIHTDFISPRCNKLMIMTGTPEPIEDEIILPDPYLLDLRWICTNVTPKNIIFLDSIQAQKRIRLQYQQGERIVYFANHVSFPAEVSKHFKIPSERIAVSFSDNERRKALKKQDPKDADYETDYQRMVNVEAHLAKHSLLRSDIALFHTTSRNKEGINIEDTDIRHVYIESHCLTDIRQMAGRIRNGAEYLYIILDSPGHGSNEHPLEREYSQMLCCQQIDNSGNLSPSQLNINLKKICAEYFIKNFVGHKNAPIKAYNSDYPRIGQFIDLITERHPYISYNYLQNVFQYNKYREHGKQFISKELAAFRDAAEDPKNLIALFRRAFPKANILFAQSRLEQAMDLAQDFLKEHSNKILTKEFIQSFVEKIDPLVSSPSTIKRRKGKPPRMNDIFHAVGLHARRRDKNKGRSNYTQYFIEPYVSTTSAA